MTLGFIGACAVCITYTAYELMPSNSPNAVFDVAFNEIRANQVRRW